jgi:hypothetical protein
MKLLNLISLLAALPLALAVASLTERQGLEPIASPIATGCKNATCDYPYCDDKIDKCRHVRIPQY